MFFFCISSHQVAVESLSCSIKAVPVVTAHVATPFSDISGSIGRLIDVFFLSYRWCSTDMHPKVQHVAQRPDAELTARFAA